MRINLVKEVSKKTFPKILKSLPGYEIIEYNIQVDHIHKVKIILPVCKVSEVVGRIKYQTTRNVSKLGNNLPWLSHVYWKEKIIC